MQFLNLLCAYCYRMTPLSLFYTSESGRKPTNCVHVFQPSDVSCTNSVAKSLVTVTETM